MAHIHSIYDTDRHFLIDPITRDITALSDKLTLIQNDHNCERYTFEIPRMVEGHDMSECDAVEVHYDNISKDKKTTNHDFYTVEDLSVSDEDNSIVIFSWLISDAATQLVGKLRFSIHFECFNEDGERTYGINTAYFDKITISSGVSNTENLIVEHSDFVSRMELLAEQNKETIEGFAENYEQNIHYEQTVKEVKDILTPLNDTLQYMTYRKKTLIAETDSDNGFSYNDDYSSICFSVPNNFLEDNLFATESIDMFKEGLDFEIDIKFNLEGSTPYSGRAEQRVKLKPITLGYDGNNTTRYSTVGFSGIIQFTKHSESIYGVYEMEDGDEKTSLLNKLISPIPVQVFTAYSTNDGETLHISFEDTNVYEVIRDNRYISDLGYPSTIQIYKIEHYTPTELSVALDVLNGEVI